MKYGQSSTFGGEFKGRWCLPGTLTSLLKDEYTPIGEGGGRGEREGEGRGRKGRGERGEGGKRGEREEREREGEGRKKGEKKSKRDIIICILYVYNF